MRQISRLVLGIAFCADAGGAQEWRTLEASRPLRGEVPVTVRVEYAAGTIDLHATTDPLLYRVKLRYDAERTTPVTTFDDARRSVTIGTRSAGSRNWRRGAYEGNTFRGELSTGAPLRLALMLGATRGTLALGGLRLAALTLKAGASETSLDFDVPNVESLDTFNLDAGAAQVTVRRGGNARAKHVHINVGAGELDYDLGGDWVGDMDMTANIALGAMTLRVPTDVGVRVQAKTVLADVGTAGLEKRGNAWVSPDYDSAKRRMQMKITTVLGSFQIVRR